MENINMTEFLTGVSAVSMLIGLALLGLTLGSAVSTGNAMVDHMLFWPAVICMGAGVVNLMPMLISGSSSLSDPDN